MSPSLASRLDWGARGSSGRSMAETFLAPVLLLVLLLSLLVFSACGGEPPGETSSSVPPGTGSSGPAETSATTREPRPSAVRVGYLPAVCQSAVVLKPLDLIGAELSVVAEWKGYPAGPAMVQAFAQKQLDIGFLGMPPVLIGLDAGVPVKVVALTHSEGSALVGRTAAGLKGFDSLGDTLAVVRQFKGRTLGVPPKGSIEDSILRDLVRRAGLDPEKDLTIMNVAAAPSLPDMLAQGQIDGMIVWPPFGTKAVMGGSGEVLVEAPELWSDSPCCVVVVTEEFLARYPGFVEDFLVLHARASDLILSQPVAAARVAAAELQVPEEVLLRSFRENPRYQPFPEEASLASTVRFSEALAELGRTRGPVPVEKVFELAPAHAAREHATSPEEVAKRDELLRTVGATE